MCFGFLKTRKLKKPLKKKKIGFPNLCFLTRHFKISFQFLIMNCFNKIQLVFIAMKIKKKCNVNAFFGVKTFLAIFLKVLGFPYSDIQRSICLKSHLLQTIAVIYILIKNKKYFTKLLTVPVMLCNLQYHSKYDNGKVPIQVPLSVVIPH